MSQNEQLVVSPLKEGKKGTLFMIKQSNICGRIYIWLKLKNLEDLFTIKVISQDELSSVTHKAPVLVLTDGSIVFDAFVIMQYLEDKYNSQGLSLSLDSPEQRTFVHLIVRLHDLNIPCLSCLYLHPHSALYRESETISTRTRSSSLAELWRQLNWLEQ